MRKKYYKEFKIIGENIKQIRIKKKISLEELSNITGIKIDYLVKIEKGEAYGLSTYRFFLIAVGLNVLPNKLVEGL